MWFYRTGYVNSQNMRMRSTENPHYYRKTGLHPNNRSNLF
ncbi:hypothetical protein BDFB_012451 [Asbolus verrucosus]|uniref:Uncharacterized protein n=1 Tax=Asbolus verrucosus TaxID=1661398 RepID=A0A482VTW3_ASBVE|nr:hypothetical protein BDFB_012451 [Asbolus verrucosus]